MSEGPPNTLTAPASAAKAITLAAIIATLIPWSAFTPWKGMTPPLALAVGLVIALAGLAAFPEFTRRWSRLLIQIGVVLMGFRMDLREVLRAGIVGAAFAAGTIILTFTLGAILGRALRVDRKVTTLLSSGTAICGGSAIAAVGSVIAASHAQITAAIGTVFVLNVVGLYLFPLLGQWLALSAEQFGTWAAIAIHDVSSLVGAAHVYDTMTGAGGRALEVATSVKLARALWIAPVAVAAAWWHARTDAAPAAEPRTPPTPRTPHPRRFRLPVPWFIALFVLASASRTAFEPLAQVAPALDRAGKAALTLALLMIGLGMSRKAIASLGWRPLVLGVTLWVAITVIALAVVRRTIPASPAPQSENPSAARA